MLVFLCRIRLSEVNGGWWFVLLLPGLKVSLCVCETERIATSLRSSVLLQLNETSTYVQYSCCHSIAETVDLALDLYILSYEVNQKVESMAGRCTGQTNGRLLRVFGVSIGQLRFQTLIHSLLLTITAVLCEAVLFLHWRLYLPTLECLDASWDFGTVSFHFIFTTQTQPRISFAFEVDSQRHSVLPTYTLRIPRT